MIFCSITHLNFLRIYKQALGYFILMIVARNQFQLAGPHGRVWAAPGPIRAPMNFKVQN